MPGGRPRKPMNLLEMSGSVKKNPGRFRSRKAAERKSASSLGPPPADWVERAETSGICAALLKLWKEVVDQDVLHVLNSSHRILVENTCHLMYKIRRASMGYGKATSGDYAQVKANLAAMGMTPVDSPRVAEAVRVPERGGSGSAPARGGALGWGEYVG